MQGFHLDVIIYNRVLLRGGAHASVAGGLFGGDMEGKMIFDGDFHLHTVASDGHSTVQELALAARERGMRVINVSDHSFSSLFCHLTEEKFAEQRRQIDVESAGDATGRGLKILQGIEANVIDEDGTLDVPEDIIRRADVLTAGFHRFVMLMSRPCSRKFLLVNGFMSERERRKLRDYNTGIFLRMLDRYPIDILAHIGHRCPVDLVRVCAACAEKGVYLELNEKHILDTAGLDDAMGAIYDTGVKFIVGSDAHRADRLGAFDNVQTFIKRHGIAADRVYGADGNMPVFKDKTEWKDEL